MELAHNASPSEHLRVNGALPIDLQERLAAMYESANNLKGAAIHIQEGHCGFVAEDEFIEIQERLGELCKRLRGENRETLKGIIEALDDKALCLFYAADAARSELRKATAIIEACE